MKKAFKFLSKFLPMIVIGAAICTIFGVLAFSFSYNQETSWLNIKSFCTIAFLVLLLGVIGCSIFVVCKVKHFHIAKIKKNNGFVKTASFLAFFVIAFLFIFDLFRLIISSYTGAYSFDGWRIARFLMCLPFAGYFLITALPSRYKRKKIRIPKQLVYICSASTVLWCALSILTVYFYAGLTTNNILKIWQILVYLSYAVFFLFEIKFELISPCPKRYLISGLIAFALAMSMNLSTIIARILNFIPSSKSFSSVELLCSFVIGIYALSKMYAVPKTMKHVIDNADTSMHSHKFDAPSNEEKADEVK